MSGGIRYELVLLKRKEAVNERESFGNGLPDGLGNGCRVLGQQPAGRQVVEAAEQTLLSLGMEEIRVAQTDSVCTIAYEDNIYRGRIADWRL